MDNKKPETSKSGPSGRNSTGHLKKSKRRNAKKSSSLGHRSDERQTEQNGAEGPSMEYANVFWQQPGMQQHIPLHNGQRLFTAMSDPSVCGYSPMPVTYAMEPVSLPPMYRLYQPVPRPGYRTLRGRPRRNYPQTHPIGSQTNANMISNGYSSLQENRLNYSAPAAYQNGDYASLPPSANNDNGTAGDELNSEHRRYSDPGLGPAELPAHCQSEDSESIDSGSSITTVGKNSKLVLSLIEQMTALKENNSQLFKELQETKSDLEDVKAELARYKHATSLDYQPGMLSDIVREIREANKVREETLIRKVKSMMEDKPVAPRSMEFDELKNQLGKIEEESNKRLVKLEDEITSLKINANNESREIAVFEEENLALRRELQEARASRTLAENQAAKLEMLVGVQEREIYGADGDQSSPDVPATATSRMVHEEDMGSISLDNNEIYSACASSTNDYGQSSSGTSVNNSNASLSGPVTDL
ncbi:uncharacterized protein LOC107262818 isoform X2 [Cephus cinctus]|uniref:Uncharacterized protein LOC107262818 isoform X2 n=1 Tax=Cephus cinctus TaxID=211228 RepID=A0AAJ7BFQ5_CEPCN|nr:uncharacterized protein LOC107262818 isoform X2 [Cephus cinctus]